MNALFQPGTINTLRLPNRLVRSATWEGQATRDGLVTPALINTMTALAEGGVGLIISSHSYIRTDGQVSPFQLGVYSDNCLPGLTEMVSAVHATGGKIIMQITHGGTYANPKLIQQPPLVVSRYEGPAESEKKEISEEDIEDIITAFTDAAVRAKSAGFDGIQLHAAHGYLLSQFLSPIYNRRQDSYGGSLENRAKTVIRILRAVRKETGGQFPILIKINCRDFNESGLTLEDSIAAALLFQENGCDGVEISGGLPLDKKTAPTRVGLLDEQEEGYFKIEAGEFMKNLTIPVILVGGIRSAAVADQLIQNNTADFISLSRPLIREPGLPNRWKSGDLQKSACLSDNACFRPGLSGKGIYCVTEKREMKK